MHPGETMATNRALHLNIDLGETTGAIHEATRGDAAGTGRIRRMLIRRELFQ